MIVPPGLPSILVVHPAHKSMKGVEPVMRQTCRRPQRVAQSHDTLNTCGGECISHLTLALRRVDAHGLCRNVGKLDGLGERSDRYDIHNLAVGVELDGLF